MIIQYDREQLRGLINNLFDLTGISLSVLDADYQLLVHCAHPNDFCTLLQSVDGESENCKKCDQRILKKCSRSGKLEGHICASGLYDSAMPIMKHNTIVGYVIMGRVRSERSPAVLQHIPDTDVKTVGKLKRLYNQLPSLTAKQLTALYSLLPSILFDNAIHIVYDPLVNEIVEHISTNLKEELSVSSICQRFHISANHLYNVFRENLDRTVNDYITEQRLTCAKELLASTDDPVYEIAENVGIGNYPYFCRLFKKRMGCTPVQYRKSVK